MVALAMIEFGAKPEEAITVLRRARPGALNLQQTNFVIMSGGKKANNSCCNVF
jgi:protein-tyrosine phosphatase